MSTVSTYLIDSARTRKLVAKYAELNKVDESEIVQVRGRGRNAATWAHIDLIISAMSYLDPAAEAKVVHEFVRNRILAWRDESGELFKDLNAAVALSAESVLGKPAHQGHYVTLARIIRGRCGVVDWDLASADRLRERARIEEGLVMMLRSGVVRDWSHLKELAERV